MLESFSYGGGIYATNECARYNSTEHPIAFHKAQDLGKNPKKISAGSAPDLEEAYEVRFASILVWAPRD